MKKLFSCLLILLLFTLAAAAQQTDTAYTKVITQRAEKITTMLGLKEKAQKKATEIVVDQYRQLSIVHDNFKAYNQSKTRNIILIKQG